MPPQDRRELVTYRSVRPWSATVELSTSPLTLRTSNPNEPRLTDLQRMIGPPYEVEVGVRINVGVSGEQLGSWERYDSDPDEAVVIEQDGDDHPSVGVLRPPPLHGKPVTIRATDGTLTIVAHPDGHVSVTLLDNPFASRFGIEWADGAVFAIIGRDRFAPILATA
ncbi:hypothetical protein SEA_ZITCH_7 [Gordonia Phage Zitch]|uniref:Uncharacterized protein n=1 Tax=Gordonia Phage Zitch TaxID=2743909 RepID=A0A7G3VBH7_9CAUD|nr:hypothetical protein J1774_gp07 [Gordonia Phage Zitch]QKY78454.1 hypothetical protein SEA_ZITCH_7 [Gordonia Phage Zitch]